MLRGTCNWEKIKGETYDSPQSAQCFTILSTELVNAIRQDR